MSQRAIHPTTYARRHVAMRSGASTMDYMSTHAAEAMQSTPDSPKLLPSPPGALL